MATNTFVRQGTRWHIIGHQSGVVPAVQRTQAGTPATPSTRDRRKLH